ncbi:MAG: cache domain-containing protein, partial [Pseudomonadota bacterium]
MQLRFDLSKRLALLLLAFALVPTAVIGTSLWQATHGQEQKGLQIFTIFAKQIADRIDRNLAQRYSDVQGFALNQAADTAAYDPQQISEVMNGYVQTYGLYPLMLLTDPQGRVLAVNTEDAAGRPLRTQDLIGTDVSGENWFQRVQRGEYSTRQPFTAPGNDASNGTVIQDLYIDERVAALYPSHSGAVIGFSAPVERSGAVLGYWYTMVDLAALEEIFETTFQTMKSVGYATTEITLLDGEGRIIIDFDPFTRGSEKVTKTDAFMKLNLAEKGVESAVASVERGETGAIYSFHARKQIEQASGYSHLTGALGYPGMNWSVLVRADRNESAAVPIGQRELVKVEGITIAIAALLAGLLVGRLFASPLVKMAQATKRLAAGDLSERVTHTGSDEIGDLADGIRSLDDYLNQVVKALAESGGTLANAAET